ncbi:MAG: YraN family protein [Candidatus Paceibacterota bacterium]|jgi:putative endonuclease
MVTTTGELGKRGEDFACGYLVEKGFQIIERNFGAPWGELDIVAKAPDKTLVFVEVKTVQGNNFQKLMPEDELTSAKVKKFEKIALFYANKNPQYIDVRRGWRMDAICLTEGGRNFSIAHYENI